MTIVDTIMLGRLGPAAIGAAGVGSSAYYSFAIFGMGLLLGLDTLVSQAYGAGNREDCHRSLTQGVYLALFLTVPLTALFAAMPPIFNGLGINPEVSALAGPFVVTLGWGACPASAVWRFPALLTRDRACTAGDVRADQRQSGQLAF